MRTIKFIGLFVRLIFCGIYLICTGCGGSSNDKIYNNDPQINYYSVSGYVEGLIGSGMVIQINEEDDLIINENGYFKFNNKVEDNTNVFVTIMSKPQEPQQECYIVNGNTTLDGADISNVKIICTLSFNENFEDEINDKYWASTSQYRRILENDSLKLKLKNTHETASTYLSAISQNVNTVSVNAAITELEYTDNGDGIGSSYYLLRIEKSCYHTETEGEKLGEKTGDIHGSIVLEGIDKDGMDTTISATYEVFKCLDDECNDSEKIEFLDSGGSWDEISFGENALLSIEWDGNEINFQVGNGEIETFSPDAFGIPVDGNPADPVMYFGIRNRLEDLDDAACVSANFEYVNINGVEYDDFSGNKYPDVGLWTKAFGVIDLDTISGELILEAAKEYSGSVANDNMLHSTDIITKENIIPMNETVGADIKIAPETFIIENGGFETKTSAIIQTSYRPENSKRNENKDLFIISAGIKESIAGIKAIASAVGYSDADGINKIVDINYDFNKEIIKGEYYRFRIEHNGEGIINVILDDEDEIIEIDLSSYTTFLTNEFDGLSLKCLVGNTDYEGDEAFIRAYFDNITLGN